MEYFGFWVTCNGVKPKNRKIEAITNMNPPTPLKLVRKFIGVVNYYCDMWPRWSHMLAYLTKLTSIKSKFKWTNVERYAFDEIKRTVARYALINHQDFNEIFKNNTNAGAFQLGAVIS